jgi:hypothetical protein
MGAEILTERWRVNKKLQRSIRDFSISTLKVLPEKI